MVPNWNYSRPWIGLLKSSRVHSEPLCKGFRTSDAQRNVMGQSTVRCHHLFICFFWTFLNPFRFLMKIFNILVIIILPTKFLRAYSTWHRTPTGPSHRRGHAEVSEPLGAQHWWHSDSYSVQGNAKLVSPMLPFCYGTVHIRVLSHKASHILRNGGTFFNVVHTQHRVAKPSIAG